MLFAWAFILGNFNAVSQNVGINTTGALPNEKALLDIDVSESETKQGFLLPRMSTEERNSITAPIPESLLIYNTSNQCFEAYNATTQLWVGIGCIGCTSAPDAPEITDISDISETTLTVSWSSSESTDAYFIDVSTSGTFETFIEGYNNLNAGANLSLNLTGLNCFTTYYIRIRAENTCGISGNSNTITASTIQCPQLFYCALLSSCTGDITDSRDGQTYATVQIGNQCWMAENLNMGIYVNFIGENTDQTSGPDNQNTSIEKYCYDDNMENCDTYGGLYQWDEMMGYDESVDTDGPGPQGICPAGWHIPTENEWKCLEMNLGMTQSAADAYGWRGTDQGGQLKALTHWLSPNDGATNSSGFSALGGGAGFTSNDNHFDFIGEQGRWWTATERDSPDTLALARVLTEEEIRVYRPGSINYPKDLGHSIRCVKD